MKIKACQRGHDLTDPANVYRRPGRTEGQCKVCLYAANRRREKERLASDPDYLERHREYHRKWAANRRATDLGYWERQLDAATRRKAKRKAWLNEIKLEQGCIDCGYRDNPTLLHFDHRDPSTKLFAVSTNCAQALDKLLAEIAKCDVRCVDCHEKRTATQYAEQRRIKRLQKQKEMESQHE